MTQYWKDLLFAHWPLPVSAIQPLLPSSLEAETFDGDAWVGVVPFQMTGVRPRLVPSLPWVSSFAELNLRTYVRPRNRPGAPAGVYFWSLDAANPLAVAFARQFFHLPYFNAEMSLAHKGAAVQYASRRTHSGAPMADFRAHYRPTGPHQKTEFTRWLTERYCLYTTSRAGQLYRGDIHHVEWPLEEAEVHIEKNTIAEAAGITLPSIPPVLHFSREIEVLIWPLRKA